MGGLGWTGLLRFVLVCALGCGMAWAGGREWKERPAAPLLEGAGTAWAAWLTRIPRAR